MSTLEVLFTPADFATLPSRDLSRTCCVVFDVLRATSTMITALDNGARAVMPVAEIADALAERRRTPEVLLAGEREGVRIGPGLTGGITFDFGNSPREFTAAAVAGRTIVMTTTNGTRALRSCFHARQTFAGSFLNLNATATAVRGCEATNLLVVCSGTFEQTAYEDVLGAGALCDLLWNSYQERLIADSARLARETFLHARTDLLGAMARSRNGRRLLASTDLREDVAFCSRLDACGLVAMLREDGSVVRQG